ncbi:MAG: hypothetical protein QXF82_08410 [Nitrososphaeria archaeon]
MPSNIKFPAVQETQVFSTIDQLQKLSNAGITLPHVVDTKLPINKPNTTKTSCPFKEVSFMSTLKYLKARNGIKARKKACRLNKLFSSISLILIRTAPRKKPK